MPPDISRSFHGLRSAAPFWSLRLHHETRAALAKAPSRTAIHDLLAAECKNAKLDSRIVERQAMIELVDEERVYLTNNGGELRQRFHSVVPHMRVTANHGSDTQVRSLDHA